MLVFLDTEFTDFTDCELISVGMVSEDGQRELYLEVQDFDRSKCNAFVQSTVWANLGLIEGASVHKADLPHHLQKWFFTLPRSIKIACDSQRDLDLIAHAMGGEWPKNINGWFDLRPLIDTGTFHHAVEAHHTPDRPWHHALYDAQAHRMGWMAWMVNHGKKTAHRPF